MIKCICLKTCQFRGYVAEKGEVVSLRDDEAGSEFIRERFRPIEGTWPVNEPADEPAKELAKKPSKRTVQANLGLPGGENGAHGQV